MSTLAPPRPARPRPSPQRGDGAPALPLAPARGFVVLAMSAYGALHWMALLDPAANARAWGATAIAGAVLLALLATRRLPRRARVPVAAAIALGGLAGAMLAGGLRDELLRPDQWGTLAAAVGRGVSALPGVSVPYRGIDADLRLVIGLGGTALPLLGALLAFWPRRARLGFPLAALLVLVSLYAVPAVALDTDVRFFGGAVEALLVLAFLRLEHTGARDARPAGLVAVAVAVIALLAAPLLDADRPWWDYESWATETASTRALTFAWDHDYGPLKWSRDGRELLRVRAKEKAYWKARNLDRFNGRSWEFEPRANEAPTQQWPEDVAAQRRWRQRLRVSVQNVISDTFVSAGVTDSVLGKPGYHIGGGVYAATASLRRGDAYTTTAYTPQPSGRQLRAAGTDYAAWLDRYLVIDLRVPAPPVSGRIVTARFPAWGLEGEPTVDGSVRTEDVRRALEEETLARTWALAQQLREQSASPFEYVERVERHLDSGFTYSESPPASARTLEGFLFDAKTGFCQQFSGAEALLLRMAGIPARVATGFSPGSLDEKTNEYVVRDFDAHSWVEVWFPDLGWVTRDPTPASAPARSQPTDAGPGGPGGTPGGQAPDLGGERITDPLRAPAPEDAGTPWTVWAALAIAAVALASAGRLLLRRRRRAPAVGDRPMAEFERALRRARHPGGAGTTLAGLERTFSGWPGAAGYVRALRDQRYSGRAAAPTPAQRRGLRAALARDAGVLRAWWALPPRRG